jgi:hypothetical protein
MNKSLLENYIKILIEEEFSDGLYGKYLFGQSRGLPTRKSPEIDLPQEKKLAHMIDDWSESNYIHPEFKQRLVGLKKMLDKGYYEDVLKPPSGKVYRGFQVSNQAVKKLFGVNYKDYFYKDRYGVNFKPWDTDSYIEVINNFIYTPKRSIFSSWSYEAYSAVSFAIYSEEKVHKRRGALISDLNKVFVVVRADADSNDFLFNYKSFDYGDNYINEEREVVSIGQIKCDKVLLFFYGNHLNFNKKKGHAPCSLKDFTDRLQPYLFESLN